MTRALGIAFVIGAVLASVIAGIAFFLPRPSHRRPSVVPEAPIAGVLRAAVLAGEDADRAVVVKPRFADPARADFTDRSLARALGLPEGDWRFVEVWVVNRAAAEVASLRSPPALRAKDGMAVPVRALSEILPEKHTPLAAMLVSDLAPDPAAPLRKGAFRSTVYAMPRSFGFQDLVSAEVDGIRLLPHGTTVDALEAFTERPRLDLIAALSADAPSDTRRADDMPEESR